MALDGFNVSPNPDHSGILFLAHCPGCPKHMGLREMGSVGLQEGLQEGQGPPLLFPAVPSFQHRLSQLAAPAGHSWNWDPWFTLE